MLQWRLQGLSICKKEKEEEEKEVNYNSISIFCNFYT